MKLVGARPRRAPSVGVKNKATTSEAESVAMSVSGRYFMNSPTMPART
jgi:hypothetical protein